MRLAPTLVVLALSVGACVGEEASAPATSATVPTSAPTTPPEADTPALPGTTAGTGGATAPGPTEAAAPATTAASPPTQEPPADEVARGLRDLLLHLDIGCLDSVLGMVRTDEIVYEGEHPSDAEVAAVSHCPEGDPFQEHDQPSQGAAVEPNQGPTLPQPVDMDAQFHGTPWTPSPDDAGCLFAAIGASDFRAVYQGLRPATASEVTAAQPCLHGGLRLDDVPHPLSRVPCPSLDVLDEHMRDYRPRWDQLACHADGLTRLPIPTLRTSARFNPVRTARAEEGGCQGSNCRRLATVDTGIWSGDLQDLADSMAAGSWEEYARSEYDGRDRDLVAALRFTEAEFPEANASFLPMADFPPYVDEEHRLIEYPPSGYWHDQALRSYAAHVLRRKASGHLTWMVDFWPPGMDEAPASGPTEFRGWIDEYLVPQKVREAQVAEALMVELFTPWPNEIERFVLAQPWADTASDSDLLDAGQYLLDAVAEAVRPHFTGRILPMSYVHHERDRVVWRDLSFRGFDEVAFGVFAECDAPTALDYLRGQLAMISDIVERDGVAWSIGEMELNESRFETLCGTDLGDEAADIHAAMLDLVFDQEVPPAGVSLLGNVYSEEHREALDSHLFDRATTSGDPSDPTAVSLPTFEALDMHPDIDCMNAVLGLFVNVFGVYVVAPESAPLPLVLHTANVLAEYIDNDADGLPDDPAVLEHLVDRNYIVPVWTSDIREEFWENARGTFCEDNTGMAASMYLFEDAWALGGIAATGTWDTNLEEVWHVVSDGWYSAYPAVLGADDVQRSMLTDAMDAARGGRHLTTPELYPDGAWYRYDDPTCDYVCQTHEYFYWILMADIGALDPSITDKCEASRHEWNVCTRAELAEVDPLAFALLQDHGLALPTRIPTGDYRPRSG